MRCRSGSACSPSTRSNRPPTGRVEAPATRATKLPPRHSAPLTPWRSSEPTMLRVETKSRARALQILYAWELQQNRTIPVVVSGISRLTGPEPRILDRAEQLAAEVVADLAALDAEL